MLEEGVRHGKGGGGRQMGGGRRLQERRGDDGDGWGKGRRGEVEPLWWDLAQTNFQVTRFKLLDGHFWTCSVLNLNPAVQITCLLIITVRLEVRILVTSKFVWAKSYQSGSTCDDLWTP